MALDRGSLDKAIRELKVKQLEIENAGAGANPYFDSNSLSRNLRLYDGIILNGDLYFKSATAHDLQFTHNISTPRVVTFQDKAYTVADKARLEAATLEEVANKEFIPLALTIEDEATRAYYFDNTSLHWRNKDNTVFAVMCLLLEPTTKGGKSLYIKNVKTPINQANATNYLNSVQLYAMETDSDWALLDTDGTDRTSKDVHESVFTAIDVSSYLAVAVKLSFTVADAAQLGFQNPLLEIYYA